MRSVFEMTRASPQAICLRSNSQRKIDSESLMGTYFATSPVPSTSSSSCCADMVSAQLCRLMVFSGAHLLDIQSINDRDDAVEVEYRFEPFVEPEQRSYGGRICHTLPPIPEAQ